MVDNTIHPIVYMFSQLCRVKMGNIFGNNVKLSSIKKGISLFVEHSFPSKCV
jgi:hypothetical protein